MCSSDSSIASGSDSSGTAFTRPLIAASVPSGGRQVGFSTVSACPLACQNGYPSQQSTECMYSCAAASSGGSGSQSGECGSANRDCGCGWMSNRGTAHRGSVTVSASRA